MSLLSFFSSNPVDTARLCMTVGSAGPAAQIAMYRQNDPDRAYLVGAEYDYFSVCCNATPVFTASLSGIGIHTTPSPTFALDVSGDINVTGTLLNMSVTTAFQAWATTPNGIQFPSTTRYLLAGQSNVGINQDPAYAVDVSGSVGFQGGIYVNHTLMTLNQWASGQGVVQIGSNVVIGNPPSWNPSVALDVNGSINYTGELLHLGQPLSYTQWTRRPGGLSVANNVLIAQTSNPWHSTLATDTIAITGTLSASAFTLDNGLWPFWAVPIQFVPFECLWSGDGDQQPSQPLALDARYAQLGQTVRVHIQLTIGDNTVLGTGTKFGLTLPSGAPVAPSGAGAGAVSGRIGPNHVPFIGSTLLQDGILRAIITFTGSDFVEMVAGGLIQDAGTATTTAYFAPFETVLWTSGNYINLSHTYETSTAGSTTLASSAMVEDGSGNFVQGGTTFHYTDRNQIGWTSFDGVVFRDATARVLVSHGACRYAWYGSCVHVDATWPMGATSMTLPLPVATDGVVGTTTDGSAVVVRAATATAYVAVSSSAIANVSFSYETTRIAGSTMQQLPTPTIDSLGNTFVNGALQDVFGVSALAWMPWANTPGLEWYQLGTATFVRILGVHAPGPFQLPVAVRNNSATLRAWAVTTAGYRRVLVSITLATYVTISDPTPLTDGESLRVWIEYEAVNGSLNAIPTLGQQLFQNQSGGVGIRGFPRAGVALDISGGMVVGGLTVDAQGNVTTNRLLTSNLQAAVLTIGYGASVPQWGRITLEPMSALDALVCSNLASSNAIISGSLTADHLTLTRLAVGGGLVGGNVSIDVSGSVLCDAPSFASAECASATVYGSSCNANVWASNVSITTGTFDRVTASNVRAVTFVGDGSLLTDVPPPLATMRMTLIQNVRWTAEYPLSITYDNAHVGVGTAADPTVAMDVSGTLRAHVIQGAIYDTRAGGYWALGSNLCDWVAQLEEPFGGSGWWWPTPGVRYAASQLVLPTPPSMAACLTCTTLLDGDLLLGPNGAHVATYNSVDGFVVSTLAVPCRAIGSALLPDGNAVFTDGSNVYAYAATMNVSQRLTTTTNALTGSLAMLGPAGGLVGCYAGTTSNLLWIDPVTRAATNIALPRPVQTAHAFTLADGRVMVLPATSNPADCFVYSGTAFVWFSGSSVDACIGGMDLLNGSALSWSTAGRLWLWDLTAMTVQPGPATGFDSGAHINACVREVAGQVLVMTTNRSYYGKYDPKKNTCTLIKIPSLPQLDVFTAGARLLPDGRVCAPGANTMLVLDCGYSVPAVRCSHPIF